MAQDRMMRAGLVTSEKVNSWPIELRYFWAVLWMHCDDHGRARLDFRLIKGDLFPLDDEVTPARIGRWMQGLEAAGVIASYEVAGRRYFECLNWDEHQDPPYFKKTDVPDRSGVVPTPAKRSRKVSNDLEPSGKFVPNRRGIEGEVEREGESANSAEPPLFCYAHPNGTTGKCGPCADARRAHDRWTRDHTPKPKPTVVGIVTDPDCDVHPGRPKRGCDRCAEEQGVA